MRKIIGITTKEELDSLELIRTKITCSKQALQIMPEGTDEEKDFYIKSVLDSLGNYTWLEQDWWNEIIKRYGLSRNDVVYVDFITGELYINE